MRSQPKHVSIFIWLVTYCVVTSTLAADEHAIPTWTKGQSRSPITWPERLHGQVHDKDGKPIANAETTLLIEAQLWTFGGIHEKELYRASSKTDDNGRYEFSTSDLPNFEHRPLSMSVTASVKDHVAWKTWWWYGMDDKQAEPKFGKLTLKPGRKLTGTCTDSNGKPIPNAILRGHFAGKTRGSWGKTLFKSDEAGRFSILAPKDGDVGFWVYAEKYGPQFFEVKQHDNDDVHIQLTEGSPVIGLVRSKTGKPIENAIVAAVSSNTGSLRAYSLPFRISARSDSKGRFRLPPITGEYRFFLTSASKHMMSGKSFESAKQIPMAIPMLRTVTPENREAIVLRECETAMFSGKVEWNNGQPAQGSIVRIAQMPDGNGSGLSIGRTEVDPQGAFRIQVPIPIERLLVYVESRRRNGKHVRAYSETPDKKEYLQFERVVGDKSLTFRFEPPKP